MIQIYCGDGKGKTTAAVGLSVRAAGRGLRVLFVQFMKGRDTGELSILRSIPGITVCRASEQEKFSFQMNEAELERQRRDNDDTLRRIAGEADSADLIVLDEALSAVERDLLDETLLKDFLEHFGSRAEVVLTGRVPEIWMLEMADYVTDMEKIRHPFDTGTPAREGIEY